MTKLQLRSLVYIAVGFGSSGPKLMQLLMLKTLLL